MTFSYQKMSGSWGRGAHPSCPTELLLIPAWVTLPLWALFASSFSTGWQHLETGASLWCHESGDCMWTQQGAAQQGSTWACQGVSCPARETERPTVMFTLAQRRAGWEACVHRVPTSHLAPAATQAVALLGVPLTPSPIWLPTLQPLSSFWAWGYSQPLFFTPHLCPSSHLPHSIPFLFMTQVLVGSEAICLGVHLLEACSTQVCR